MSRQRFRFSKSRRLTKPREFDQVRQSARAQRGEFLVLSVLSAAAVDRLRAGFVTSRAVGSAVVRNRVRRRLREIVRKHQHEIRDGIWIVTIARGGASAASYEQLEAEWLRLARRASILAP
ncbi:MAG TPA: ribonuclease P protein component [Chthoniobacterales bacterium]|jgi:ribonuclease P protein component|nr:ribonuclease P protein component [Chthoniobacterales bacterium]